MPTIFSFKPAKVPRATANSAKQLSDPLTPKKRKVEAACPDTCSKGRPASNPDPATITPHITDHDYIHTDSIIYPPSFLKTFLPEIQQKITHLEEKVQIESSFRQKTLTLENIKDNPKQMQFWTGFPSFDNFKAIFDSLEPRAKNMVYWRGHMSTSTCTSTRSNKPGPERKLDLLDEFFMTMVRLKVGLLTEDLAQRFNVSAGTVSSVVTSWVNLMNSYLRMLCHLPPKSTTDSNKQVATDSFEDLRIILDCTELFVQNPSNLNTRKQLFSNYKHHNTFKFLIGISPNMGITYVSRMYGGRASDKFITTDSSDLLQNLNNDKGSVMTDRGFLIHGLMNDMGITLHMPSFKGSNSCQLSPSESFNSEKISKIRIHIERAIQRIKTYHILDGELKLSMKHISEQVFTVCAYLVNFQAPIIKT